MTKTELKKRVFDKLEVIHAEEMDKLKETFIAHVREVNKMDYAELEQMNKELLHALHKKET